MRREIICTYHVTWMLDRYTLSVLNPIRALSATTYQTITEERVQIIKGTGRIRMPSTTTMEVVALQTARMSSKAITSTTVEKIHR